MALANTWNWNRCTIAQRCFAVSLVVSVPDSRPFTVPPPLSPSVPIRLGLESYLFAITLGTTGVTSAG